MICEDRNKCDNALPAPHPKFKIILYKVEVNTGGNKRVALFLDSKFVCLSGLGGNSFRIRIFIRTK